MPSINVNRDGDLYTVEFLNPQLNDADASIVGAELQALVGQAPGRNILLDFHNVQFLCSLMIGQILAFRKRCRANGGDVKICRLTDVVREVIEIMHLQKLLDIYEDQESARASFENDRDSASDMETPDITDLTAKADADDANAQLQLARCHDNGIGMEQNEDEAIKWYIKSAEAGHPEAQHSMGHFYAYGINVPLDYNVALDWFRKSAEQGHAESQYILGTSYHYGIGVNDDRDEAASWYKRAGEQGHEASRAALSKLAEM